jgi:hypothetical protein
MKNVFNEAVLTNPEEVKGGTLFLLSWLFGGYRSYGYGGGYGGGNNCGCNGGSRGGYSKW